MTLRALFRFRQGETELALGLMGCVGAEEVATSSGVSLDTVRGRIRAMLCKVDAANLRDFERPTATVGASVMEAA